MASETDIRASMDLFEAAIDGDFDRLQTILEENNNIIDFRNEDGETALHMCLGNLKCTKLLISNGANLSIRNKSGHTPLHEAAKGDLIESLIQLLIYGADVNGKSPPPNGAQATDDTVVSKSPIELAKENHASATADFLLFCGANVPADWRELQPDERAKHSSILNGYDAGKIKFDGLTLKPSPEYQQIGELNISLKLPSGENVDEVDFICRRMTVEFQESGISTPVIEVENDQTLISDIYQYRVNRRATCDIKVPVTHDLNSLKDYSDLFLIQVPNPNGTETSIPITADMLIDNKAEFTVPLMTHGEGAIISFCVVCMNKVDKLDNIDHNIEQTFQSTVEKRFKVTKPKGALSGKNEIKLEVIEVDNNSIASDSGYGSCSNFCTISSSSGSNMSLPNDHTSRSDSEMGSSSSLEGDLIIELPVPEVKTGQGFFPVVVGCKQGLHPADSENWEIHNETPPNGQSTTTNGESTKNGESTTTNGESTTTNGQSTPPNGQSTTTTTTNGESTTTNGQTTTLKSGCGRYIVVLVKKLKYSLVQRIRDLFMQLTGPTMLCQLFVSVKSVVGYNFQYIVRVNLCADKASPPAVQTVNENTFYKQTDVLENVKFSKKKPYYLYFQLYQTGTVQDNGKPIQFQSGQMSTDFQVKAANNPKPNGSIFVFKKRMNEKDLNPDNISYIPPKYTLPVYFVTEEIVERCKAFEKEYAALFPSSRFIFDISEKIGCAYLPIGLFLGMPAVRLGDLGDLELSDRSKRVLLFWLNELFLKEASIDLKEARIQREALDILFIALRQGDKQHIRSDFVKEIERCKETNSVEWLDDYVVKRDTNEFNFDRLIEKLSVDPFEDKFLYLVAKEISDENFLLCLGVDGNRVLKRLQNDKTEFRHRVFDVLMWARQMDGNDPPVKSLKTLFKELKRRELNLTLHKLWTKLQTAYTRYSNNDSSYSRSTNSRICKVIRILDN